MFYAQWTAKFIMISGQNKSYFLPDRFNFDSMSMTHSTVYDRRSLPPKWSWMNREGRTLIAQVGRRLSPVNRRSMQSYILTDLLQAEKDGCFGSPIHSNQGVGERGALNSASAVPHRKSHCVWWSKLKMKLKKSLRMYSPDMTFAVDWALKTNVYLSKNVSFV